MPAGATGASAATQYRYPTASQHPTVVPGGSVGTVVVVVEVVVVAGAAVVVVVAATGTVVVVVAATGAVAVVWLTGAVVVDGAASSIVGVVAAGASVVAGVEAVVVGVGVVVVGASVVAGVEAVVVVGASVVVATGTASWPSVPPPDEHAAPTRATTSTIQTRHPFRPKSLRIRSTHRSPRPAPEWQPSGRVCHCAPPKAARPLTGQMS